MGGSVGGGSGWFCWLEAHPPPLPPPTPVLWVSPGSLPPPPHPIRVPHPIRPPPHTHTPGTGDGCEAEGDRRGPAQESPGEEEQEEVEQGSSKRRKSDGGIKLSGMREGQRRTPHTLYFKYSVAMEYEALKRKKEQGTIADPLGRTSALFCGLSKSNIWNWWKQREELRAALMQETSGQQQQKRRMGKLVAFSSKAARRMACGGVGHVCLGNCSHVCGLDVCSLFGKSRLGLLVPGSVFLWLLRFLATLPSRR